MVHQFVTAKGSGSNCKARWSQFVDAYYSVTEDISLTSAPSVLDGFIKGYRQTCFVHVPQISVAKNVDDYDNNWDEENIF